MNQSGSQTRRPRYRCDTELEWERHPAQRSRLHAPGIADVVTGNNTVSFKQGGKWHRVDGFHARPGYDLASGVGTINGWYFVHELAMAATHPQWSARQLAVALGLAA